MRRILESLLVMGLAAACAKVKTDSGTGGATSFEGVRALSLDTDGKLILSWDSPSDGEFDVYMQTAVTAPSGTAMDPVGGHGVVAVGPDPSVDPRAKGQLLATLASSERQMIIAAELKPYLYYAFQVILRSPDGELGAGRVLIRQALPFDGCASVQPDNACTGRIAFQYPEGASKLVIYRDDDVAYTTSNPKDSAFLDTLLFPGKDYRFRCEAVFSAERVESGAATLIRTPELATTAETVCPAQQEPFKILAPAATVTSRTVTVTWEASLAAEAYRLVVGTDRECGANPVANFDDLEATEKTLANPLPDGRYFACVYARDTTGLVKQAANSPFEITVNAEPGEFALTSPLKESWNEHPKLKWQPAFDARRYRVVIDDEPSCEPPVIEDKQIDTPEYVVQAKLTDGDRYVCLSAIDKNGDVTKAKTYPEKIKVVTTPLGTWQAIPTLNAPSARVSTFMIARGDDVVFAGGSSGDLSTTYQDGAVLQTSGTPSWSTPLNIPGFNALAFTVADTGAKVVANMFTLSPFGIGLYSLDLDKLISSGSEPMTAFQPSDTSGLILLSYYSTIATVGNDIYMLEGIDYDGSTQRGKDMFTRYDLETATWKNLPHIFTERTSAAMTPVGDRLFVYGGLDIRKTYNCEPALYGDGAVFDTKTEKWERLPSVGAPSPRASSSMVATDAGVFLFGGVTAFNDVCGMTTTNSGAMFDIKNNTWSSISSVRAPTPRAKATIKRLGRYVVVWGGCEVTGIEGIGCNPSEVIKSGAVYDTASDGWRALASTPTYVGRQASLDIEHAAALTTNGKLVIWGGYDENDVEINTGGILDLSELKD